MKLEDKVLRILNKDEKARELHYKFKKAAKEHGLEPGTEEYQQAEQTMLMFCIYRNNEAISTLAEETYRLANG